MIILWTDALIYLLILVMLALGLYLRGKEHIKRPLQQIGSSKIGMISLVVLLFFVLIGLLDSVHFKPADDKKNEIISLLDDWATPLREHGEKTYSAPFATKLYSKEMMAMPDGSMQWGYPRLEFGGRHLDDPETQRIRDILQKGFYGLAQGVGLTGLFMMLYLCIPTLRRGNTVRVAPAARAVVNPSTKVVWLVLFIIVPLATTLIHLSAYYHVFGTDKVGEDVFYQAVKSIRTGLVIGTLTTLIMLPMAIIFGILAGFFRGWVDDVIQYVYTTLNSIPGVLLIAASILMVQVYMANHEAAFTSVIVRADMRLLFLCMILGVTSWTGLCRLLRAETLKLREMEYVQAAHALGVKQGAILLRHILPNVMHIVLISVVLDFSSLVLAEAVLSYINIGVDPTSYSWGNMINGARLEMAREPIVWWSLTAAFVFMFALVLAANLFADVVQDAFDPRRSGNE
ncbi:ABC transporter permease [Methylobacter tundripaludum]|uniref:ABC-type transporter, integral membrane subunit n=1 Tax=Methylobacter tundripaludum (strain ATCC BAA-1195 / DSM 17260 / SV96) TaxID=697282 RepID=G3J0J5_METTV|nr:ABC transporter permease [Methylobacter tundripaludum]EGW20717.1 ABC-type transporter, integral membrane subunit [Methylobacter tundripaludum SV96]